MTCRMCDEQDDFCDGNSSENLCKNCLDHCCEECFYQLETEQEYEHNLCNECYTNNLYKKEPEYFTFNNWEIEEYEEDCMYKKIIEDACKKRKQEKLQQNPRKTRNNIKEEDFKVNQWYLEIEEVDVIF